MIDLEGLSEESVRDQYPEIYQHLLMTVKPERDQNREPYRRLNWWKFGRKHSELRSGIAGLARYAVTVKTSRHRFFTFLDGDVVPDSKLYAFAVADAFSSAYCLRAFM